MSATHHFEQRLFLSNVAQPTKNRQPMTMPTMAPGLLANVSELASSVGRLLSPAGAVVVISQDGMFGGTVCVRLPFKWLTRVTAVADVVNCTTGVPDPCLSCVLLVWVWAGMLLAGDVAIVRSTLCVPCKVPV